MKIAITIGAFLLHDFIHLNIKQCQKCFPDAPILVSDDQSDRSPAIADISTSLGATYIGSNSRRGHFAGDIVAVLNSLSFAEAHEADIAIKVSQRFVFKNPKCKDVIESYFLDEKYDFAIPGRMDINTLRPGGNAGFSMMPVLTDIMCFRLKACKIHDMCEEYRDKVRTQYHTPAGTFVEAIANDWAHSRFKDRTVFMDDFTKHTPGRPGGDLYLRRNQNNPRDYLELARQHNLTGDFRIDEWGKIEGRSYFPRPRAV